MEINTLYNENCLDTMQRMPDNFIDLTVTSPPYDKLGDYKGFKFPFKHIARHLYRVTKFGGVVVWVVGDATVNGSETGTSFTQALFFKECGFRLHDTMIYRKENYAPQNHNRYEQAFEYMFILSKGRPNVFNPKKVPCKEAGKSKNWSRKGSNTKEGVFRRRDELITTNEFKSAENIFTYACGNSSTGHPAPFPEGLVKDQILSWSNEGGLIYDAFAGSATTLKMAHLLKRNWIGSEISKEYCDLSEKRLAPYLQQMQLL